MSTSDIIDGENFRVLGQLDGDKEAQDLKKLLGMTPAEKSQFYLEQALQDVMDAMSEYSDDELIPVSSGSIPEGQVLLRLDDVSRWVQRLQEIPDFVLNDDLVRLLIDIISTTDASGQKLDIMAPEFPALKLVPQH